MGERVKYKHFPQLLTYYFIKHFFNKDSTLNPILNSSDTELKDISGLWEIYNVVKETDE